jgi:aminoglycoside phosphotransferase family enzyme/predicted kinase
VIVEDQTEVRRFLAGAVAKDGGAPLATEDTHISHVVLGPSLVWKLKRAVLLPYADFSTPERRLAACRREVELNRRTAPAIYRRVRRITREPGRLAFDGPGALVDAVVEMRRFDRDLRLDRLADRGALDTPLLERLAAVIADAHASAPVDGTRSGSARIADVLGVDEAAFATTRVFAPEEVGCFNARFCDAAEGLRPLLDARGRAGRVRLCHGDLHLRNIVLHDGAPVLFDCIEFNDGLATIDVLYDLAFLLMDLVHRGLGAAANLVMNRYLDLTGDEDGLPLVPFFMALRAAVRAHVTATGIDEGGDTPARRAEARAYFDLALRLLDPRPIALVAIGGLSGSGKSTVAEALAPLFGGGAGARVLSSDRLRKALWGVAPETRLPPAAYAPEVSARVYGALVARAGALAVAGTSVVADAVFAWPSERARIAEAAHAAGVPFRGYWLHLAPDALRARVAARRGGPSDADLAVLERQLGYDLGPLDWPRLDAAAPAEATAVAIAADLPDAEEASLSLTAETQCG